MKVGELTVCPLCGIDFIPGEGWTGCPACGCPRFIIEAVEEKAVRGAEEAEKK